MTNKNQKLIELSANLLNQVVGGCNHKCACEALIDDIKGIPDKISDAMPDLNDVEARIKKVPGKVDRLIHNL